MKANGEIISTIAAPRNATIFARSTMMHRLELGAMADRFAQIHLISKQPAPRHPTRDDHCFRVRLCRSLVAPGKNTAELTKLPEDVLMSAHTAKRTSPITIDENIVKEVLEASDRATRYGILSKKLDVSAVDRSFTAAANLN